MYKRQEDVLAYKARLGEDRIIPLDGMRKTIAARMCESLSTAAQYTIMGEACLLYTSGNAYLRYLDGSRKYVN